MICDDLVFLFQQVASGLDALLAAVGPSRPLPREHGMMQAVVPQHGFPGAPQAQPLGGMSELVAALAGDFHEGEFVSSLFHDCVITQETTG